MRFEQKRAIDRSMEEISTSSGLQTERVKELEESLRKLVVELEASGRAKLGRESLTDEPKYIEGDSA